MIKSLLLGTILGGLTLLFGAASLGSFSVGMKKVCFLFKTKMTFPPQSPPTLRNPARTCCPTDPRGRD